ncbi:MAG: hypothetical protein ACI8QS_002415 [Planctomycetota bacterium]|jgi:uncharacterized protein (TIGR00266 family)
MQHNIIAQPSYSLVEVTLEPGEELVSDSGAMAWMDTNVTTKTAARGGIMQGLKRKFLSGESFFQNTYTAEGGPGTVALAPGAAGDVVALELDGELLMERGAYLGGGPGVKVDSKWGGLKGFFNEGLFVLRCHGKGTMFFGAYGDIQVVDLKDEEYVVDNGFAVAWEPQLSYRLSRARKIRSFLFSDQILLRFQGTGRIWVQTRSSQALANFAHAFRSVKRRGN